MQILRNKYELTKQVGWARIKKPDFVFLKPGADST